jgi:hypothetical protein
MQKVSLSQIENGRLLSEMMEWYRTKIKNRDFNRSLDRLMRKGRAIAKKRGYTSKVIDRTIAEVRAENR